MGQRESRQDIQRGAEDHAEVPAQQDSVTAQRLQLSFPRGGPDTREEYPEKKSQSIWTGLHSREKVAEPHLQNPESTEHGDEEQAAISKLAHISQGGWQLPAQETRGCLAE